ncbi:MAG: PPOX class F420-dependent oxidoreductase [Anaerolineae bacterium]|nr:PPOX class F420-dependent oxidoreductase [Anaerolineae bacterium]
MTHFTPKEIEYLSTQKMGRLATLSSDGAPNNLPVMYRYNPDLDTIDIGGLNISETKKFRNVRRDGRVSFVVDDVQPPWEVRGGEIRGVAQTVDEGSSYLPDNFDPHLIRIKPTQIISWGIDTHPYTVNSRKIASP